MIIWVFVLRLLVLCNLRRVRLLSLVLIIIFISFSISCYAYTIFCSTLSLIWLLVYLGGIIICTVYILFITIEKEEPQIICAINEAVIDKFILVRILTIFSVKFSALEWGRNLTNHHLCWMRVSIFRETYCQMVVQSPFFFFFSIIILIYSLFQIITLITLKSKNTVRSIL